MIAFMTTLAERISQCIEERGCTITQLADAAGVKPPSVSDWLNGKTKTLKAATALRVATFFGVNILWLTEDKGPRRQAVTGAKTEPLLIDLSSHPDLREVPRVKFKLSAGVSGYAIEPENGNGRPVFFRQDWFSSNGYRPEKLFAVRISGASMEPSLWDGDLVVINTADTIPHDGEAFAINYEGELVIKRLRRDAGEWWATSDNADQRRFAPKRCTDGVVIIGRVIYKQSERI